MLRLKWWQIFFLVADLILLIPSALVTLTLLISMFAVPREFAYWLLGGAGAISIFAETIGIARLKRMSLWQHSMVTALAVVLVYPGIALLNAFGRNPP